MVKLDGAIGAQYTPRYSPLLIFRVTPLAKLQVALIVVAYLSEPVTVSFIYPFINEVSVFSLRLQLHFLNAAVESPETVGSVKLSERTSTPLRASICMLRVHTIYI
jgi:hypothetical protein